MLMLNLSAEKDSSKAYKYIFVYYTNVSALSAGNPGKL